MSPNMSVTMLLMKGKKFTKFTFFLLYSAIWINCVLSGGGQSVSSILRCFQSESQAGKSYLRCPLCKNARAVIL